MISRRFWVTVTLVVAGLSIGYWTYWRITASQLERGLAEWVASERRAGNVVDFSFSGVVGFPLAFQGEFKSPDISLALSPNVQVHWSGPSVSAMLRPWDLRKIHFEADGEHRVQVILPIEKRALAADLASINGWISISKDGLPGNFGIKARDFEVRGEGIEPLSGHGTSLVLTRPEIPPVDYNSPFGSIALSFDTLTLPQSVTLAGSNELKDARINIEIMGPVQAEPMEPALRAWRDAGGTLEVRQFAFRQGEFAASGDATIALDDKMQPMGAGHIEATGLAPLLAQLSAQGQIDPGTSNLAQAAVKAIEVTDDKGVRVARLGLSLQDNLLRLGPVPLARLPKVQW